LRFDPLSRCIEQVNTDADGAESALIARDAAVESMEQTGSSGDS
jgi:hypothetical protein